MSTQTRRVLELNGSFAPYDTPEAIEALRAWATWLARTEAFDRSMPHKIIGGVALVGGPYLDASRKYNTDEYKSTVKPMEAQFTREQLLRYRRVVEEYVNGAIRNGDDYLAALRRFLDELPTTQMPLEVERLYTTGEA